MRSMDMTSDPVRDSPSVASIKGLTYTSSLFDGFVKFLFFAYKTSSNLLIED